MPLANVSSLARSRASHIDTVEILIPKYYIIQDGTSQTASADFRKFTKKIRKSTHQGAFHAPKGQFMLAEQFMSEGQFMPAGQFIVRPVRGANIYDELTAEPS